MKLYASELMELARKEPQKYEGKRYKVVEGSSLWFGANNRDECVVVSGRLTENRGYSTFSVYADTVLEEILPEPKPVPFMEAVKAYSKGKTVDCKVGNCRYVYQKCEEDTPYKAMHEKNDESSGVSAKEILEGAWHICE